VRLMLVMRVDRRPHANHVAILDDLKCPWTWRWLRSSHTVLARLFVEVAAWAVWTHHDWRVETTTFVAWRVGEVDAVNHWSPSTGFVILPRSLSTFSGVSATSTNAGFRPFP
jgi:hypothetical protein